MTKISLKIMYSDVMATIEDGVNEKVTLNDDNDVANKVKEYLEEKYAKKELEEISILLLSYLNPPQLPSGVSCKKWTIKCESHAPFVTNLLNSIPLHCDFLHIEIDNGSFGMMKDMEQLKTAKDLSLMSPDETFERVI